MPKKYIPSEDRFLIPRLGKYIRNAQEFIERTKSVFRTGGVRDVGDAVLILASQSVVFTTEEIMSIFRGNRMTIDYSVRTLKQGKHPFLKVASFTAKQGQSFKYYYITAAGLKEAFKVLNGHYYNNNVNGTSPSKAVHTYGTGMNIYQAFFAGFPFRTKREAAPKGQKYTDTNGLFTDVIIYAYPEEFGKTTKIFVEEDTGGEARSILMEKLRKYDSSGYMDNKNDAILFSFLKPKISTRPYKRKGKNGLDTLIFNEDDLREIAEGMKSSGHDDAFSYYDSIFEKSWLIEDFLVSVDGARRTARGLERGTRSVTGDFIESYLYTRKFYQNPYIATGINVSHYDLSNDNLRMFAENFALLSGKGEYFLRSILSGFQVFCCATPLSCDAMRFILLGKDIDLQQAVGAALGYGRDLTYDGRRYRFKKEDRLSPVLRNVFKRDNAPVFAFELTCFDAGSWYRLWYAVKRDYELSFPVVCAFYDLKQAEQFFRYLGRYDYDAGKIKIFGILYWELLHKGNLFYPSYNKFTDTYDFYIWK